MNQRAIFSRCRGIVEFLLFPIGVAICAALAVTVSCQPMPSAVFREFVYDPIPKSVSDINADRARKFRGHVYVLRFHVARPDFDLISSSRPFKQVQDVRYSEGRLDWYWSPSDGYGIPVYPYPGKNQPVWFTPQQLKHPDAYVFVKQKEPAHFQILLYSEEMNEAYFVEYRAGSH